MSLDHPKLIATLISVSLELHFIPLTKANLIKHFCLRSSCPTTHGESQENKDPAICAKQLKEVFNISMETFIPLSMKDEKNTSAAFFKRKHGDAICNKN